jgi:HK97 family phage prohead protease
METTLETALREQYGQEVESRVVEIRAAHDDEEDRAGELVVEGYAARFNEVTDLGYFREEIAPGAFDNVLDNDVRFLFNHKGMPLARSSNGTLQMEVREEGLYTRAVLSDTQQGRDLYKAIKRGDISQMSFAFTIERDTMDSETNTRTVHELKSLLDVSAVSYPAYPTTTLEARERAAVKPVKAEPTQEEESAPEEPKTVSPEVRTFETKLPPQMNINDLKGQRAAYYEEFVAIGQLADQEGRAMTEAEQERADTLDGHITAIDQKIKHKQREQ